MRLRGQKSGSAGGLGFCLGGWAVRSFTLENPWLPSGTELRWKRGWSSAVGNDLSPGPSRGLQRISPDQRPRLCSFKGKWLRFSHWDPLGVIYSFEAKTTSQTPVLSWALGLGFWGSKDKLSRICGLAELRTRSRELKLPWIGEVLK